MKSKNTITWAVMIGAIILCAGLLYWKGYKEYAYGIAIGAVVLVASAQVTARYLISRGEAEKA